MFGKKLVLKVFYGVKALEDTEIKRMGSSINNSRLSALLFFKIK
jgi:hypothetical protein